MTVKNGRIFFGREEWPTAIRYDAASLFDKVFVTSLSTSTNKRLSYFRDEIIFQEEISLVKF